MNIVFIFVHSTCCKGAGQGRQRAGLASSKSLRLSQRRTVRGPLLHADPLPLTNPALGVVSLQRANPLAVCEPARCARKRSVHPVS